MAEFLDNNENIIRGELLAYYHFRATIMEHINNRMETIKNTITLSEYDYCTTAGQIMELESLIAFLKEQTKPTEITKIMESTNKKD